MKAGARAMMKLSIWSIAALLIILSRTGAFSSSRVNSLTRTTHRGRTRRGRTTTKSGEEPFSRTRFCGFGADRRRRPQQRRLAATAGSSSTTAGATDRSSSSTLLSNAELSRPLRRDVFNYDAWVEHRSPDRFITNLIAALQSIILRHLLPDTINLALLATFICIYNGLLVIGYDDWTGWHHPPLLDGVVTFPIIRLPSIVFGLTTPFLALLLVFKTNTSYKRWDEGRKNWGAIVNSSRTILRQGAAWIHDTVHNPDLTDEDRQKLMVRLEQAVWCFSRSVTRHLLSTQEDEAAYTDDCRTKLRPDLAEALIVARHKPTRALYELSTAIAELPIDERRQIAMDASVTVLCDSIGSSERIFTSPVPRFFTRHTARFLEIWLFMVPFGLYEAFGNTWNHWGMIPISALLCLCLLGIDELGLQLEEPFSVLPQHAITENSIGKVLTESVGWRKTDYERMLEAYYNSQIP